MLKLTHSIIAEHLSSKSEKHSASQEASEAEMIERVGKEVLFGVVWCAELQRWAERLVSSVCLKSFDLFLIVKLTK